MPEYKMNQDVLYCLDGVTTEMALENLDAVIDNLEAVIGECRVKLAQFKRAREWVEQYAKGEVKVYYQYSPEGVEASFQQHLTKEVYDA